MGMDGCFPKAQVDKRPSVAAVYPWEYWSNAPSGGKTFLTISLCFLFLFPHLRFVFDWLLAREQFHCIVLYEPLLELGVCKVTPSYDFKYNIRLLQVSLIVTFTTGNSPSRALGQRVFRLFLTSRSNWCSTWCSFDKVSENKLVILLFAEPNSCYQTRLEVVNLEILEIGQIIYQFKSCYKIINQSCYLNFDNLFIFALPSLTRCRNIIFTKRLYKLNNWLLNFCMKIHCLLMWSMLSHLLFLLKILN